MDSAGSALPAWRRLGLKLKNESQSGEPVPEPNGPQTPRAHQEDSYHAVDSSIVAENGKPSKLGKRKHQDEPAEGRQTITKKSKKDPTDAKLHGITGNAALEHAEQENGQPNPRSNETGSDEQRPKGDPNYRKKKRKGKQMDGREPTATGSQFRGFTFDLPSPGQDDLAATGGPTLVVSTEREFEPSAATTTPLKHKRLLGKHDKSATSSLSPPQTDRRKSVTFTPDTKTTDGNSAQNLFKKWVQEQKGADAEFSQAEVVQFAPPPKSHPANLAAPSPSIAISKETEQAKHSKKEKPLQAQTQTRSKQESASLAENKPESPTPQKSKTSASKGKKDPSLYVAYLTQYHTDRKNWKFNKAKQNDVVDNALNVFRIPMENDEALYEYIKGLQGAGVIERLREKCNNELEALNEAEANEQQAGISDDHAARQNAKEEALQERLTKERKRRQLDGDIENLVDHPNAEGYIRRLKRARAERLLDALKMAAPVKMKNFGSEQITPPVQPVIAQRNSQKRKSRMAVSSDESSSSSSEESSGSSESESEDSEDESNPDSESESDSDSGSDASDSAGSSSSSSSSSSDNDSDSD